jgi:membrane-associated phospholipid phosphatase
MNNAPVRMIKEVDIRIQNSIEHDDPKNTPVDTFLKWAPFLTLFALQSKGLKTKNDARVQVLRCVAGEIILDAVVFPLKKLVHRVRPNGDNSKSFPSRHTATSFLGSSILHEELKETLPVLSYSGYVIGTITGTLRIYHNKHWFSDVASGALFGILAAKISGKLLSNLKEKTNGDRRSVQSL